MTFSHLNRIFLCKDTKKNKKPTQFNWFFIIFAQNYQNVHKMHKNRKNLKL